MHPAVLFYDADKSQVVGDKLCLYGEFAIRIFIRSRGVVHCTFINDLLYLRRGHVLRLTHCLPALQRVAVFLVDAAKLHALRLCIQFDLDLHRGGRGALPCKVVQVLFGSR